MIAQHDLQNADAGAQYDALLPSARILTQRSFVSHSHNMNNDAAASSNLALVESKLFAPPPLVLPEPFRESAAFFAQNFRDPKTLKRRRRNWIRIRERCAQVQRCPLPMDVETAIGITSEVAWTASSLSVVWETRSTIAFVHRLADLPDPTLDRHFKDVWKGIVRVIGTDHPNAKWAILAPEIGAMVDAALALGTAQSQLDACVIAALYEFALRRRELCAAPIESLFLGRGITLEVVPSKGHYCKEPVTVDERRSPIRVRELFAQWLNALGRERGPLFPHVYADGTFGDEPISGATAARIVKRYAALIGLPPKMIGAHSPRAGWATQGIDDGLSDPQVAAHLRHDSLDTLLQYYRPRMHRRLIRSDAQPALAS